MEEKKPDHFIQKIIKQDIASGRISKNGIITRFPPEPNGYLHIGHAKAICLSFGLAEEFGGRCHLRFDDTNPETAKTEYIQAIQDDIKWLGFDWGKHLYYASDYFEQLYMWAVFLIQKNLAFVDDCLPSEIQKMRGSLTQVGKLSPFRNRNIEENLELFEKMKSGQFEEGSKVLRAKIDMSSGNMNLRDPILYRILKRTPHPRTGHKWSIYPTYDFAHGQSDAIEKITHSLCTLEFKDHRPLYDWFLEKLEIPNPPRQYEFARLNLDHTVLSKRHLLELVNKNHVNGWDDPRMPTLRGMRHRGYPANSIRQLCEHIGVTTSQSTIGLYHLEDLTRKHLDPKASRFMAVMDPIKITLTNYPKKSEILKAKKHPKQTDGSLRGIPFSKNIFIERSDFESKFHTVGSCMRLKYAYVIRCDKIIKNANHQITDIECSYYEETKSGQKPSQVRDIKQKPPIVHWVCADTSHSTEVRHYDRLFCWWEGTERLLNTDLQRFLNRKSLVTKTQARIEKSAVDFLSQPDLPPVQFERLGYYVVESAQKPLFNRVIALKDLWMPPHVFYEHLCKQKDMMSRLWDQWDKMQKFHQDIQDKHKKGLPLDASTYRHQLQKQPYRLVIDIMQQITKQIERKKNDPSILEQGFMLFNSYVIRPHFAILKSIKDGFRPSLIENLSYRLEALQKLLCFDDRDFKDRLITDFLEEKGNKSFVIPIKTTSQLLTEKIQKHLLNPLQEKKAYYAQREMKGQLNISDIQELGCFLEDMAGFLKKHFDLINQMRVIHVGSSFEESCGPHPPREK